MFTIPDKPFLELGYEEGVSKVLELVHASTQWEKAHAEALRSDEEKEDLLKADTYICDSIVKLFSEGDKEATDFPAWNSALERLVEYFPHDISWVYFIIHTGRYRGVSLFYATFEELMFGKMDVYSDRFLFLILELAKDSGYAKFEKEDGEENLLAIYYHELKKRKLVE